MRDTMENAIGSSEEVKLFKVTTIISEGASV